MLLTLALAFLLPPSQAGNPDLPKPFKGSATITGVIQDVPKACEGEMQIWISQSSTLLYQASAMKDASFEFHVMPGPHEVTVISQTGCLFERSVKLRADEVSELRVALKTPSTPKAQAAGERKPAQVIGGAVCPYCGASGFAGGVGMGGMGMGMGNMGGMGGFGMNPWWSPFGMMNYSNFFYPAPWMWGGIYPSFYPGPMMWPSVPGGGMMGKPNMYFDGPAGQEIQVQVEMTQDSNWLAAVPMHGTKGWKGKIQGPDQLELNGAKLAYAFYDYRLNPTLLQSQEGFCTAPETLMPKLTSELERAGFSAYEVKDFREYWQLKLPRAPSYCVYPQDERQLSRATKLKITPAPEKVIRIAFMIVPQDTGFTPDYFKQKPRTAWTPHAREAGGVIVALDPPATANRTPASKTGITVREWGVGFLASPQKH